MNEQNAQTPEQKREIIERLYQLWLRHPELKLGQLVLLSGMRYRSDYNFIQELEWCYRQQETEA